MNIEVFRGGLGTIARLEEESRRIGGEPTCIEVRFGWREERGRWICNVARIWGDGRIEVLEEDWTHPGMSSSETTLAPGGGRTIFRGDKVDDRIVFVLKSEEQ